MKTERKLMVIGLVCLLVSIAFGSAFAVTRTITNTGDNVDTFIRCSNGNYYDATEANLRTAIYAVDNTTRGWVELPYCNISINQPIYLNDVYLYGHGDSSQIYLADSVNKTMFIMGNNSMVSDLKLNGNCWGQPIMYSATRSYMHPCIYINSNSRNIKIQNCNITRAQVVGIYGPSTYAYKTSNITIDNTHISFSGARLKGAGTLAYMSSGIWLENASKILINNVHTFDCYSVGICIEAGTGTAESRWTSNFTVSDCIIERSCYGFYAECTKNGIVTGCSFVDCNVLTIFGLAAAVYMQADTKNIMVMNCISQQSSGGGATTGDYCMTGYNNSLSSCKSINSGAAGVYFGSTNGRISHVSIHNPVGYGIYSYGYGIMIDNCNIYTSGDDGIYMGAATGVLNKGSSVVNCRIKNSGDYGIQCRVSNTTISDNIVDTTADYGIYTYSAILMNIHNNRVINPTDYGIYTYNGLKNSTISQNIISGVTTGIRLVSGSSNNTVSLNHIYGCTTGILESSGSNFNKFLGNNCKGCSGTPQIDVAGTNTTWFCSAARCYGFNTGSIS